MRSASIRMIPLSLRMRSSVWSRFIEVPRSRYIAGTQDSRHDSCISIHQGCGSWNAETNQWWSWRSTFFILGFHSGRQTSIFGWLMVSIWFSFRATLLGPTLDTPRARNGEFWGPCCLGKWATQVARSLYGLSKHLAIGRHGCIKDLRGSRWSRD